MKMPAQGDSLANILYIGAYNRFQVTDKDTLGIQNIWTPMVDLEETTCISFKDYIKPDMKNIGVLFNFEFFWSIFNTENLDYYNNMKFTYFYDSEFDKYTGEIILKRIKKQYNLIFEYELISIEKFSESKDIKDLNETMSNKHFDIVFSNPPYNGNIDLKILQTVFDYTDKAVFIHPAGYLFDKKFKEKIYNNIRNTNYLEEVNLFWGNKIFDINLFLPLCISVWNTEKTSDTCKVFDDAVSNSTYYTKIKDISFHGANKQGFILKNTALNFINKNGSIQSHITDENQLTDYSVKFALIRGHALESGQGWKNDFFSLICLDKEKNYCDHTFKYPNHVSVKLHWSFNNEQERKNFINYCKTKVVRFCLSFLKVGSHLDCGELEIIPWMDFTQDWNDKKLCEEFNISEDLWKYIDKFIPDYYDDYKSGF